MMQGTATFTLVGDLITSLTATPFFSCSLYDYSPYAFTMLPSVS